MANDPRRLSPLLRTINVIGRGLARVGLEPGGLDVEANLAKARAQTGLDDFDRDDFRVPFELLCADLEAMGSELSTVGRLGLLRDFERSLCNRLRIREWVRRHPEILDEPIVAPIFIIGSPRTGTTMLHNLLSRVEEATAPAMWELLEPAPHLEPHAGGEDPRVTAAKRFQAEIERVLPQLGAAHSMVWNEPEECMWLFANTFMSEFFLVRSKLPRYSDMFLRSDWSWAVAEYREALQLLQWQRGRPMQWILKAPGHSFRMAQLCEAFPDARFIRTHRDPCKTIASSCSLFEMGQLPVNRHVDPHVLGEQVLASWVDVGLERLVDTSAQLDARRCFDVDFRVLMADPFALIEQMWAHFGLELGEQVAMRAWLDQNPRHHKGRHTYELERYGISETKALEHTQRYRARFAEYLG